MDNHPKHSNLYSDHIIILKNKWAGSVWYLAGIPAAMLQGCLLNIRLIIQWLSTDWHCIITNKSQYSAVLQAPLASVVMARPERGLYFRGSHPGQIAGQINGRSHWGSVASFAANYAGTAHRHWSRINGTLINGRRWHGDTDATHKALSASTNHHFLSTR